MKMRSKVRLNIGWKIKNMENSIFTDYSAIYIFIQSESCFQNLLCDSNFIKTTYIKLLEWNGSRDHCIPISKWNFTFFTFFDMFAKQKYVYLKALNQNQPVLKHVWLYSFHCKGNLTFAYANIWPENTRISRLYCMNL